MMVLLGACRTLRPTAERAETANVLTSSTPTQPQPATANGPTPTPFIWPEPLPSATPCPNTLPQRLVTGERGRVTDDDPTPMNVRQGPRTSFERIGQIPIRGIFFVLEGPECSERYAWYRVQYNGLDGWIAEGDDSAYYVEPYPAE